MCGTVRLITLGCAKNEVDSDKMRAALEAAGFEVLSPAGADGVAGADVVIVNTCSFIEEATRESIDVILDVAALNEEAGNPAKIVVAGCMPARYAEDLEVEFPEVAAFVPVDREGNIAEIVSGLVSRDEGETALGGGPALPDALTGRTLQAPYAYVKISDGCDRFCSFCTIPFIRGRYKSRPASDVLGEVGDLVSMGTQEVILIGQDTGIWGDDLGEEPSCPGLAANDLPSLLDLLAGRHPDTWFRVMYLQPGRTDDRLLDVMAARDNVCSYLDIPLQHCSARVLAEMNREGSRGEYEALLARIRRRVPGVALRTTMIAGFPGETDDEADDLVDFIEKAGFDYAGVFEYSREDGTAAAGMPGQIDPEVKVARAQAVRDAAEEVAFSKARARIGSVCDVLVCGVYEADDAPDGAQEGLLWGRTMFQAPDVDGIVVFEGDAGLVGQIVPVRMTDAAGYDLEGELTP